MSWKIFEKRKREEETYISINKCRITFSTKFIREGILGQCRYVRIFHDDEKVGFLFSINYLKNGFKLYKKGRNSTYCSPVNFIKSYNLSEFKGIKFIPTEETIIGQEGYSILLETKEINNQEREK